MLGALNRLIEDNDWFSRKAFLFWLCIITATRLYFISPLSHSTPLILFFDEAQYWMWSKEINVGYFSKPPMIAWIIALFTDNCGDTPFCVKLPAIIIQAASAFGIFLLAKLIFNDRKISFWSGMTYLMLPAVSSASIVISADSPLMLCWIFAAYFFYKAILDEREDKWWALSGVFFGLGLLSKYTMIAFGVSTFLFLLLNKTHRGELIRLRYWIGNLTAFVIFMPNLYWNANNQFISFAHNKTNVLSKGTSLYPQDMAEFIIAQFGMFGPILLGALIWGFVRLKHDHKDEKTLFLACLTIPLFIVAIAVSLISGAQAHWAAPIYAGAAIWVTSLAFKHSKTWMIKSSFWLHACAALALYHITPITEFTKTPNPLARMYQWNAIAPMTVKALNQYPNSVLVTDERKALGPLAYNLRNKDGKPYTVIKWNADKHINDHFDLTTDLNQYVGYNVIFVTRTTSQENITKHFASHQKITSQTIGKNTFSVLHLIRFKGY